MARAGLGTPVLSLAVEIRKKKKKRDLPSPDPRLSGPERIMWRWVHFAYICHLRSPYLAVLLSF